MERVGRLLVLASTAAALLTYIWLVDWIAGVRVGAPLLFLAGLIGARLHLTGAMACVSAAAFVLPGVLSLIVGTTDFHAFVFWQAAAAGVIIGGADARRWSVPRLWVGALAAWTLIVACTWPIVAGRELDFSLAAAATLDTPNGVSAPAPRFTAGWILHSVLGQLVGLLWFDLLWARFGAERLRRAERAVILPLLAGATAGALVAVYQGLVDISFLNGSIWPHQGRASGLLLDANSLGISAAMCGPLAVAWVWRAGRPTWHGVVVCAILTAGLWFAGSRTALLALSIGGLGIAVAIADRRGAWHSRYIPIGLLLGAALVLLLMVAAPRGGNSASPLQRIFDRLPTPDRAAVSQFIDEMWTRFGYGPAAERMIREYPVSGVGVASFHVIAPDYIFRALSTVLPADNAQNWWRHQLAELGVLGALPAIICSLLIAWLAWRGSAGGDRHHALTVLRGVLVGVGTASVLGVPIQHPAVWLLSATVIFWATALADPPTSSPAIPPLGAAAWGAIAALTLVSIAGQATAARDGLRVPTRAQRIGYPYRYGFSAPEFSTERGMIRSIANRAVEVFAPEQEWLALTVWTTRPDAAARPVPVRLDVDDRRVLEVTLSDQTPVTRYLSMGTSTRLLLLEVRTAHSDVAGPGVRMARRWLHDVPPGVPPEHLLR